MSTLTAYAAVPEREIGNLRILLQASRTCKNMTLEEREICLANARECVSAITALVLQYGVSARELSRQSGFSPGTLPGFLTRMGGIPSEIKRKRPRAIACKAGHDLTKPNSQTRYGQCRMCQARHRAKWVSHDPDGYQRQNRRSAELGKQALQKSQDSASRKYFIWTGPELEIALRNDLTIAEIAKMLNRTTAGVMMQRYKHNRDLRTQVLAGIVRSEL